MAILLEPSPKSHKNHENSIKNQTFNMSCAHPCALLRGPAFFSIISCSQNPICPEDVIERTFFLDKSRYIYIYYISIKFDPPNQKWVPLNDPCIMGEFAWWCNKQGCSHSVSWDAKSPSPNGCWCRLTPNRRACFRIVCLQIKVNGETKTYHTSSYWSWKDKTTICR